MRERSADRQSVRMTTIEDERLVVTASVEEVLEAIEALDLEAPWEEAAPFLRIALPRRRELPPDLEPRPERDFPPCFTAGLGLDIGPAMLFVARAQLEAWGVTEDEAYGRALQNVRDRVAAKKHHAVVSQRVADVPMAVFQSHEGWASNLLLLPDELMRVLGERDGIILAPMRDVVIRLPFDTDGGFVVWLLEEFAAEDMNALDVPILALEDGELREVIAVQLAPSEDEHVH